LLNSRLGLFTAALRRRAPLLPKLRGHFAEFLNESSPEHLRILSSPTCVGLRYGHLTSPRGFSWQCGIENFGTNDFPPHHSLTLREADLPTSPSHCLDVHFQSHAFSILLRPPIVQTKQGGTGISTCCPSPTPFGLSLGPD
jgi:hypothetical protein